ncbi:type II toxin-antitoxin system HicA family toxin [Klebsiella michiganensis]|uniref:type II toxin-antitoxin system HicA family toxin n=1 Tax=Klebsiella michiganensis TaxID=1134687 RepID=UPI0018D434A0|nr:type II toxin-antitoxin system HicA family toxin [Klebsiella michiganensis]MDU4135009.1 type II toxin-antitoxin system HicA family toxin [Klebsiella michiganensis]QPQ12497.1 type II toxin-antitoxin system HicA family toxin [Klebsiella michiganensis]HBM3105865.1 type II toxin-antitoxin system HicA family toxin [Klebsiella oxytoca]HDX8821742.1 type II toxin-antitoxin system HicA family toxin [Klebsiella michiganensis]
MGRGLYVDLVKILLKYNCKMVRQGKGSHEIWFSPSSNKNVSVPVSIVSKLTANGILKLAGIKDRI